MVTKFSKTEGDSESTALFRVLTKGAQKRDTHFSKTEGDSVHEVTIKRTKGD